MTETQSHATVNTDEVFFDSNEKSPTSAHQSFAKYIREHSNVEISDVQVQATAVLHGKWQSSDQRHEEREQERLNKAREAEEARERREQEREAKKAEKEEAKRLKDEEKARKAEEKAAKEAAKNDADEEPAPKTRRRSRKPAADDLDSLDESVDDVTAEDVEL